MEDQLRNRGPEVEVFGLDDKSVLISLKLPLINHQLCSSSLSQKI